MMRRSLLTALTALLLMAWPAQAQLIATTIGAPAPTVERTVLDITTRLMPGGKQEGHCLVLEAGRLSTSVTLAGRTPDHPVTFTLYRVRGASDALAIFDQPITRTPFEHQSDIEEGLFCYHMGNMEPEPPGAGLAQLSNLTQDVAIKVTLTPR